MMQISYIYKAIWLISLLSILQFFSSCGGKTDDGDVQKKVADKISSMRGYDAVQANVRNGIVFLTGQCEGNGCAKQLEEGIRDLEGVIAVENDITEGRSVGR